MSDRCAECGHDRFPWHQGLTHHCVKEDRRRKDGLCGCRGFMEVDDE